MNILGTTDTVNHCEKCNKQNLKKTVVIELDNMEIVYYGSNCAARAMNTSSKNVERTARHKQSLADNNRQWCESVAEVVRAFKDVHYKASQLPDEVKYNYKQRVLSWMSDVNEPFIQTIKDMEERIANQYPDLIY